MSRSRKLRQGGGGAGPDIIFFQLTTYFTEGLWTHLEKLSDPKDQIAFIGSLCQYFKGAFSNMVFQGVGLDQWIHQCS